MKRMYSLKKKNIKVLESDWNEEEGAYLVRSNESGPVLITIDISGRAYETVRLYNKYFKGFVPTFVDADSLLFDKGDESFITLTIQGERAFIFIDEYGFAKEIVTEN